MIISPTGSWQVRNDGWGLGHSGAPRKKGNISYAHRGRDLESTSGTTIVAPVTGTYIRIVYPYRNTKEYVGMIFGNEQIQFKMLYFEPSCDIFEGINQGDQLGFLQAISNRYPPNEKNGKMLDHLHFEIIKISPEFFMKGNHGLSRDTFQ